jgi:hypothetical protein
MVKLDLCRCEIRLNKKRLNKKLCDKAEFGKLVHQKFTSTFSLIGLAQSRLSFWLSCAQSLCDASWRRVYLSCSLQKRLVEILSKNLSGNDTNFLLIFLALLPESPA